MGEYQSWKFATVAIRIDSQQSSLNRLSSRGFHYQAEQTEVAQCRGAQPGLIGKRYTKVQTRCRGGFPFAFRTHLVRPMVILSQCLPFALLGTFTRPYIEIVVMYPHGRIFCVILRIQLFSIRIGSVQFPNPRLISLFSTVSIRR